MINAVKSFTRYHSSRLIRIGTVGGLLLALPVVGWLSLKISPLFIIAAVLAPIAVPVVFFNLQLGPLLILLAATATEWYISKGITPALILTILLAAVWVVQQMVMEHRIELIKSPVMTPSVCFILAAVISLPWGKVMADPLLMTWPGVEMIQLAQLAVLVCSPVALILAANLLSKKRHLEMLVYVYLGFTTIGILAEVLRLPLRLNLRGLTSTWAVSLLYGQLLFNNKLSKWIRLAFLALTGVWLYTRLFLGLTWLSGWLPVVISVGVITFLWSRKMFLLLLVLLLVVVFLNFSWWQEVWATEDAESGNRFDKWSFLFSHHSTRGHWLLGTGPFGYAMYFMTYFPGRAASTHSNYIDLFLQMGVVGCVAFVWMIGAIAWIGFKLCKISTNADPFLAGFARSALGGLAAVLVAMFLGDWFTPFVLNQGLHGFSWTISSWVFLGALVAVPVILERGKE